MQVDRLGDMTRIRFSLPRVGDEQWFLLRSDAHHDSAQADNRMEREHLDEAVARDAYVLDFGDLFDAMQSPHDRRASMGGRKSDHMIDQYFNQVLDDAEEFYAPYASRILMLARGNHENSVIDYNGFDLTRELVRRLNVNHGGAIHAGGYDGWVRFKPRLRQTVDYAITLYYTHGSGGSSPVTRGVIKTNRRAVYLPDADIVVSGHTHQSWMVPIPRYRISALGVVAVEEQLHVQLPSYKRPGEWERQREFAPPPQHGAYWLRVWNRGRAGIRFDVQRAI
jgi:predicted phosphodiesterase